MQMLKTPLTRTIDEMLVRFENNRNKENEQDHDDTFDDIHSSRLSATKVAFHNVLQTYIIPCNGM